MSPTFGYTPRASYVVIALVSCAVLLYEIALVRVLSVVVWYHFAFLVVSLAMLGLGAPGVWFSIRPPGRPLLWRLLIASAVAIPLSIFVIVKIGEWLPAYGRGLSLFGTELPSFDLKIGIIVLSALLPLLTLGSAVCFLLLEARGRGIGAMYASDLLGATLGACLVVPLMHLLPTPILLASLGFLPLLAAWVKAPRHPGLPIGIACLLLGTLLWGEPFQVRHTKVYTEENFDVIYEKWTPTARLTVFPNVFWLSKPDAAFGWGMGSRYRGRKIEQLWIEQDGGAGSAITRLTGAPAELEHLFYDVTSVGYQLRPAAQVCIIGAGGGRDILTALKAGAEQVDAVELNPYMIEAVSDVFGEFSGDVYHLPRVRPFVSEGRSFLTQSEKRYDLIQIALIDSWAATTAGAYALSENYLYTVESMHLYLSRLSDTGILSISRWMRGRHQLETARLVLLAREVLAREGVSDPLRRMAVMQGGRIATLLVSSTPFDAAELTRLDAIATERGFTRHWPPPPKIPENSLVIEVLSRGAGFLEGRGLNLAPPTDDRPFFFQSVRAFSGVSAAEMKKLSINDRAARLPRSLIEWVGGLTLVLFFSPFLLAKRLERHPRFWLGSGYFLAVGLGFMLVEVPFIQKFVLYLGHPSFATTAVLSTILLGSGLGSATAGRIDMHTLFRWRLLLPLAVALVGSCLGPLYEATLGWSLASRILLSVVVMGPLGFFLGFAFPTGMIRFGDGNRGWFWAVNGAASVLASVTSITLASYLGLTGVVWMGLFCYLVACAILPRPEEREGVA